MVHNPARYGPYKSDGFYKSIIIFSIVVTVAGCAGLGTSHAISNAETDNSKQTELMAKVVKPQAKPREDGSLWSEYSNQGFLFGDIRARQIGDVVTIKIIEDASGSKDATTKTEKDSSLSAAVSGFFGLPVANRGLGTDTKNNFSGKGSTTRSGKLTARVTATVINRLANGNLVITGERRVLINDEEQDIKLVGTIRPEDIDSANQVLSSRIANANIEYTGKGIFEDRQKPGWGARLFDLVWPF